MKPFFRLGATALVMGTFATAIVQPARADEVAAISQADLTKAIAAKKVVIFDVNGTDSYKAGRIPTALNYAEVGDKIGKVLPTDKSTLVVAYCGSPQCGAYKKAALAAMKLGYTNVKHFSPGIKGWKESGAEVEKG